jgi:pimeloyl-ACP methyl ester carboxylesterase
MSTTKRTIVLVHGLWVTPLCWQPFRRYFENQGHEVIAPAWPGIRGEVAEMRRDPSSFNGVGARRVVEHYAKVIRDLPVPPIIMGHSYGGCITQMLIDRGLGAAGVAIDSVPPKGILVLPLSTNLALLPALLHPRTYRATFLFSFEKWWKVFANTLPEAEARAAYAEQAIPAPGRAIFQAALANFTPNAATAVNFRNPKRAPLLFIGGEEDVIMPASLSRKIARKHQASPCVTDYKEFPGRSHYIIAESGWQEVADYALTWAEHQINKRP